VNELCLMLIFTASSVSSFSCSAFQKKSYYACLLILGTAYCISESYSLFHSVSFYDSSYRICLRPTQTTAEFQHRDNYAFPKDGKKWKG